MELRAENRWIGQGLDSCSAPFRRLRAGRISWKEVARRFQSSQDRRSALRPPTRWVVTASSGTLLWVTPYNANAQGYGIYRSADSGKSWTLSPVHIPTNFTLVQTAILSFPDSLHGFLLVGSDVASAQQNWALFKTGDQGRTWTLGDSSQGDAPFPGTAGFVGMTFISGLDGWIVDVDEPSWPGSFQVYRTVDGGSDWTRVTVALPLGAKSSQPTRVLGPFFTTSTTGSFVIEGAGMKLTYRTSDGGLTWSPTT